MSRGGGEPPDATFRFRLYTTGRSPRGRRVERQLRELCARRLERSAYEVEVVDVERDGDLAEAEQVVATPTVDRLAPEPRARVIGDLGSPAEAAAALGIPAPGSQ